MAKAYTGSAIATGDDATSKRLTAMTRHLQDEFEHQMATWERAGSKTDARPSWLNTMFRFFLMERLLEGAENVQAARRTAQRRAALLTGLWGVMAIVGLALIVWSAIRGLRGAPLEGVLVGLGAGGADLALFLFFRPTESIKRLLADMMQLELAVSGYQTRVGLELLAFRRADAATVKEAAHNIGTICGEHIAWIEEHFTTQKTTWTARRAAATAKADVARLEDTVGALVDAVDELPGAVDVGDALSSIRRRLPA